METTYMYCESCDTDFSVTNRTWGREVKACPYCQETDYLRQMSDEGMERFMDEE